MLKVFEAFAGVGSQRMALRNLGIEHKVVGICEIDKFALKSYEAIHGDCPNFGDISKVDPNDLPNMDLFTYSFPCQDLSVAGKQKGLGEGTRSGLLYECEKIIEAKKPKYLLLENVKNLVGKKFKNDFDKWLNYLEGLGYKNYWKVLNAKDYGVPQNRERVFVVSILNDNQGYEFPKSIKLTKCIKDILENEVDEKFYMNKPFKLVDKGRIKAEFTEINFEQTKRIHGTDSYFQSLAAQDRGINNILVKAELTCYNNNQVNRILGDEGICSTLDTMQGGHREPKILTRKIKQYVEVRKYELNIEELKKILKESKIKSGLTNNEISNKLNIEKTTVDHWFRSDNCFSIPSRDVWFPLKKILNITTKDFDKSIIEYEIKENKFDTSNRVYLISGLSPTLTCDNEANAKKILEHYKVRKLTPLECWRLMSFSDEDFYKAKNVGMSNSQLYKQAGNSIVVKVLEGILENLFLNKSKENEFKTTTVKFRNKNVEYEQLKWII